MFEAAKRAARALGVRAKLSILGDSSVLGWANRELLLGVLTTLCEDAIAASDAVPELTIRTYATRTEARISLRDSVSGPAASDPRRAFEPVIKLAGDDGSGLSLPLVRHAVARMRGTIELARDGAGRVFRIRLKRA
jgi:signal transduction histidine kinase